MNTVEQYLPKEQYPATHFNLGYILFRQPVGHKPTWSINDRLECLSAAVSALAVGIFSAIVGVYNLITSPFTDSSKRNIPDHLLSIMACPLLGGIACIYHIAGAMIYPKMSLVEGDKMPK